MNRNRVIALILSCLTASGAVRAQVSLEILDAPPSVSRFEPIWVTFEVRNDSRTPIIIPADTCNGEGAFLEVGPSGTTLTSIQRASSCVSHRLVWVPPGGRWLFFQPVALGFEGTYEIEAVLRSPGECGGSPVGPHRHRIEPARPNRWGVKRRDCWSGEARSLRIWVEVTVPTSQVDLEAAEFLGVDRWGGSWERPRGNWQSALMRLPELPERFPTSHYTYAAYWATGRTARGMLAAVILQPDNPLNRWVAGGMAEYLVRHTGPCAPPERQWPGTPPDIADRYERVVAAYPPPEPVKDYLRQVELEVAAQECADSQREEGDEGEP